MKDFFSYIDTFNCSYTTKDFIVKYNYMKNLKILFYYNQLETFVSELTIRSIF